MFKVGQDHDITKHLQICDPIKKALGALDPPNPLFASTLSSGELIHVSSPIPDIVKLPMYDGLCIIAYHAILEIGRASCIA